MSFREPLLLLALVLLPLAIAAYVLAQRRRKKFAVRYTNIDVLAAVAGRSWGRHIPAAFALLALTALLVSLGRPERTVAAPQRQGSVIMVTDTSGSMQATDVAPTRLAAAQAAATALTKKVPEEFNLGLVTFNNVAESIVAPTTDRDQIRAAIQGLKVHGSTAMGDGLKLGLQSARAKVKDTDGHARRVPSVLVLLSDGKSERGSDPVDVADQAKKLKIPIYTIALGHPERRAQPQGAASIPVPPDNVTLRDIAETTGGRFFAAPSAARLETIYENLGVKFSTKKGQAGGDVELRRHRARAAARRLRPRAAADGQAAVSRRRATHRPRPNRLAAPERTPERPGPGPIPPTVLRSLDLAVLRRVESLVPGEHLTPQVGGGTEFALIRPYRPGDDVRHMDWNVTARLREPHVRVHVGERAMTAWLLLDVSASMTFGTADRRKADVAEGVALAVGHVATRRGNRLGVVALGRRRAADPAPAPGPPRAARAAGTSCARSRRRTSSVRPRSAPRSRIRRRWPRNRGLIVVVSDFRGAK